MEMVSNLFKWYTILSLMVVFSNFNIGSGILSQYIFGFLSIYYLIKYRNRIGNLRPFLYFVFFFALSIWNYFLYSNIEAMGSSLRFVFNLFIYLCLMLSFDNAITRTKIVDGYEYACVFFSLFVIVQFLSFYILGVNLTFDFGEYMGLPNHANEYDPTIGGLYRTGGMFSEPSWYASFVTPSVFILTQRKKYIYLGICVVGTVFSTSGVGFAVLAIYSLWVINRLKPIYKMIALTLIILSLIPLAFLMSHALSELRLENSRLLIFSAIVIEHLHSLFGVDPHQLYYGGEFVFFMNTAAFIYLFYGIVGFGVFIKLIYFKRLKLMTLSIIAIMAIEGLYGRVDFWIMILVGRLYNNQICFDLNKLLKRGNYMRIE